MLKSIFTWWNSATIGIRFTVARRGVFIGEDDYGNRYYQADDPLKDELVRTEEPRDEATSTSA